MPNSVMSVAAVRRRSCNVRSRSVGRLHEETGRPVLTAAAADQAAAEGAHSRDTGQRHGYFTWAVLDALRRGASNGNGSIGLTELAAHVQEWVPKTPPGTTSPQGHSRVSRAGARRPIGQLLLARRGPRPRRSRCSSRRTVAGEAIETAEKIDIWTDAYGSGLLFHAEQT
jgi:hypothetical protein